MSLSIQSRSIYHGLPVFPGELKGLTAIVAGANGISGDYMLQVLCESPERWTKIYALSRRPPNKIWPAHVKHLSLDFMDPPEKIAEQLRQDEVKADYIFFFAYIQPPPKEGGNIWSAVEDLVRVNKQLLVNFLEAQALNNSLPKHILLQLGAKYYGLHLGPAKTPLVESDPRVLLEPNFYYDQEDYLKEFAQKHNIGWNTTRPAFIPGAVTDASMDLCFALGIYATVQKYLNQPLVYPADFTAWTNVQNLSSAATNCYLAEWAVLTKGAENQSFNAIDGAPFSWEGFWPQLADRFGLPWTGPDLSESAQYHDVVLPYDPPPRGYGPQAKSRFRFTLTEWAKRPEVSAAWREIAKENNLRDKELREPERLFGFIDVLLMMSYPALYSVTKLRKLGYFGYVDTSESIIEALERLVGLRMIPQF
ncbi:hypothetical protein BGW36DRAFT_316283 [Talaromyces proteolyticus]|uniref:PRISE-like Rossmann-fold domain-containing protein n=1 Tax=Talaromyces proteolyticus TaxID=1131652 RepID=A0AAD4Q2K0_9EURO|nr:uncharacterized protein BGW36DRAFT_316283 [Talaromyces proteolyticus]KAH8700418.1 hypothetical protein BGW36DRAFT_316283 [Talaromyces proteolyticus]